MTERSMLTGLTPTIIIKVGVSVVVRGEEGDRVRAVSEGHWGLQVDRKKDDFEVKMGGSGEVWVPLGSNLKIYAGMNMEVQGIRGLVDAVSGLKMNLVDVATLGHAQAGGSMHIDCHTMAGQENKYEAGGDLDFRIHDLTSARIRVKDLGGYWEARIGGGEKSVYLKSGGDVTLVTDQKVEALPPNYILGRIIKPAV
jgi:hypothetical protein